MVHVVCVGKTGRWKQNRNILLSETKLVYRQTDEQIKLSQFLASRSKLPIQIANNFHTSLDVQLTGQGGWSDNDIELLLDQFNLKGDIGLSVLAVEMLPRYEQYIYKGDLPTTDIRPLSQHLGRYRILRTSPLVAAPEICCENCV